MDEIDAGREFLKRLDAYRPVMAACWLREEENEERYLHVALDGLTDENTGSAYREVLRVTQEMKDHYMDPFRVKLITQDNPVAKAVMEMYRQYPGRIPSRFNGRIFSGMTVVEAYIYPQITGKP